MRLHHVFLKICAENERALSHGRAARIHGHRPGSGLEGWNPMRAHTSPRFVRQPAVRRLLSSIGALSAAVTLFSFGSVASPAPTAATTSLTPQVAAKYAKNMLHLLNTERAAHGERPLRMNGKLVTSA